MSSDIDVELELAKGRAAARKRAAQPPPAALPEPSPSRGPGVVDAALEGAKQGATLGFADELGGVMGAGAELAARHPVLSLALPALGPLGNVAGLGAAQALAEGAAPTEDADGAFKALIQRYRRERDANRAPLAAATEAHPLAKMAGEVAGGLLLPGPGKAPPMATVASRAKTFGKYGAATGGAVGAGASDADLTRGEVVPFLVDTAKGSAAGGALGAVMGPATELAISRLVKPWASRAAEQKAVDAVTPTAGLRNRLRKMGVVTDDETGAMGRDILDRGILKPLGTAKGALARNTAQMEAAGGQIGDITKAADAAAALDPSKRYSPTLGSIAAGRAVDSAADTPAMKAEAEAVKRALQERIAGKVGEPIPQGSDSFVNAWQNKSQLQQSLKPGEVSDLGDQAYRAGVRGYRNDQLAQLEQVLGPDEVDRLREAAKTYGNAAKVEDLLREAVSRQRQRAAVGLLDFQAGGQLGEAAKALGVPGMAPVMSGVSSLMRGRMDSTLATGLNALAGSGASTLSNAGAKTSAPAYAALAEYFGRKPQSQEEAADTHFIEGQTNAGWQAKNKTK